MLLGAEEPVVSSLLAKLPLFAVTLNERLVFLAALAFSTLGALGVERCLAEHGQRRMALLLALVALGVGVGAVLLWDELLDRGLSPEFLTASTLAAVLPPLLAAGLLVPLRHAGLTVALLVGLLLGQRIAEAGDIYPTLPERSFFPLVAPLDALPESEEPYRVVGHEYTLLPNGSALYGIEDPRGYQAMHFGRLLDTFPLWSERLPVWFNRVDDLDAPFLAFLNVRYALVRPHFPVPSPWRIVAHSPGAHLAENPRALPRSFVPERVRLGVPTGRVVAEMARETDFSTRAWISGTDWDLASEPVEMVNGPGRVSTRRVGLGYLLDVDLAAAGWVVVSETAWRGWRVTADGGSIPLAFGNHAFLAFFLPPGEHRVELRYRPRSFDHGLALTLLSFIVAGALVTRLGRRRA